MLAPFCAESCVGLGGSPLTLGRDVLGMGQGLPTPCTPSCSQRGPRLREDRGEEGTSWARDRGCQPHAPRPAASVAPGSEKTGVRRGPRGSAGLEMPRAGPEVPTGDFQNIVFPLPGPRELAPNPRPRAALATHLKKSSRSGGYLPKSAVRFLAVSSLARQDSWAERRCRVNAGVVRAPSPPQHPPAPPGLRGVCSPPLPPTWAPLIPSVVFCSPWAKARTSAAGRSPAGMHWKPCGTAAGRLRWGGTAAFHHPPRLPDTPGGTNPLVPSP